MSRNADVVFEDENIEPGPFYAEWIKIVKVKLMV